MNVQLLKDLLEWWLETLRASLPSSWHKSGGAGQRRLTIRKAGVELSSGKPQSEPRLVEDGEGLLAGALKAEAAPTVVAIEASRYVLRTLSQVRLPTSRAKAMATFDVASATPFKPDEVHCLTLRSVDPKRVAPTTYAVVKRAVLDPVLAEMRAARVQPAEVLLLPPSEADKPVWMVNPADLALLSGARSWRRNAWAIAGGVFAVAVVATFLHLQWNLSSAQAAAEAPLPELEAKAKTIRAELNKRATRIKEINALRHSLATQRSMTEIWEELSRVLPDTAYVTALSAKGGNVTLEGFSPSAASIIEPIESSAMFKEAAFSSAVIKVPGKDGERFQINLEVLSR